MPSTRLGRNLPERAVIRVRGLVQGVGFRPTVYRAATRAHLAGFVRNDGNGVWIEIEGDPREVSAFPSLLRERAPAQARIDAIDVERIPAKGDHDFHVVDSLDCGGLPPPSSAPIPPELATCDACLRELFDRSNRRYRYPFINCTDCGPRFTIVESLPYDRARTTMRRFTLCDECRAEYENPANRRFHAEANACAACGPRLSRPLEDVVADLHAGKIVAIKSLGGFHLACDAANNGAVQRLRERKRRPHKPFAIMARDLAAAETLAHIDDTARAMLTSAARPIVIVDNVGIMLPYTPLHHMLLAAGPPLLVMTSGNRADEPIAIDNADALARLADIADSFLLHDRDIHTRADDSVCQPTVMIRRSRGFVPEPIELGAESEPILAVGAELKSTIALTRGSSAYVSQHIGDLETAQPFFEETIAKLQQLLGIEPRCIAHDLHPDYFSTRWAMRQNVPRIGVQHHHAHIASCLAENGRSDRVIGVAFDGTGCGPAGELWGGEFLVADLASFERAAWLRPIALPGGEIAIRQPWRLAMAALIDAGEPVDGNAQVRQMIERNVRSPKATSAGRWFDAIAAICGIRDEITYEAQAAMELEAVADPEGEPYDFAFDGREVDMRPVIRAAATGKRRPATVSAHFHETMAAIIARVCAHIRENTGINTVAISGGCFQNRRLTSRSSSLLERDGFEVLTHHRVPPNDGGIALGQAAVALHSAHVPRHSR